MSCWTWQDKAKHTHEKFMVFWRKLNTLENLVHLEANLHKLAPKISRQKKTNQGMHLTSLKYVNVVNFFEFWIIKNIYHSIPFQNILIIIFLGPNFVTWQQIFFCSVNVMIAIFWGKKNWNCHIWITSFNMSLTHSNIPYFF